METVINTIINVPAASWYHLAAFVLTGAGAQYSVQIVKILSKNKFGKGVLRFLNGLFSTLYVAAGAYIAGGGGIGNMAKSSAAVATISVLIYRIHNSFLYKSADSVVKKGLADADEPTTTIAPNGATLVTPTFTPESSFSGN